MKKKLLALLLVTTTVLTFAACGSKGNTSGNNNTASTPSGSAASTPSSAAASTPSSSAEEASATVADWYAENPSEVKAIEDGMNSQLAAAGFSCKINADGNVFIYEYYVEAITDASSLSADDLAQLETNFAATAESTDASVMFDAFEEGYGIKMDAIRFVFYAADGTELYTGEIENK